MINFLDDDLLLTSYSCSESKMFPIFQMAKFIIVIIQIAVPFALIIWGSLDFFKALIAHDEKEMRMKRKPFFTRVIAAMIVLILPWIMQMIADQVSGNVSKGEITSCDYYTDQGSTACNSSETQTYTCTWNKAYGKCVEYKKKNPYIATSCGDFSKEMCNYGETPTYTCQWRNEVNRCVEKTSKKLVKNTTKNSSTTNSFWKCYSEAKPKIDFSSWQNETKKPKDIKILGGSSSDTSNK